MGHGKTLITIIILLILSLFHPHLRIYKGKTVYILLLLLFLLVFSPWAGLDRDQSSVRQLVWL